MNKDFWLIQQPDKPLFPELVWSKPEGRSQAGKILIIGGSSGSFNAPAKAYNEVLKTGIGTVRVILPTSLQKTVGKYIEEAEFAPSNSSGSFSQKALDVWLEQASWADGILFSGDLGHSSETAVALEKLVVKTAATLTLAQDTLDHFLASAYILERPSTTLVPSFNQLQKLCKNIRFPIAITSTMNLLQFVEAMHVLSNEYAANIVIAFQENTIVAVNGRVSSTKFTSTDEISLASRCLVWTIQNPSKSFEALTTAVVAPRD